MKHLSLFLILLSFYCCTTNTTNNNSENAADSLANTNDSLPNVHPSLLDDDPWNDTTEYTPEVYRNFCDTLVGNFSGGGIDTLIAEPIGYNTIRKNFKVTSKNGTVPPLYINEIYCVYMNTEGDLDGNGTDEFGICWELEHGTWRTYHIFTYKDSLWHQLESPISIFYGHFDEGLTSDNIAEPSKKKGHIVIRESHGGEDFYIKKRTIKPQYEPLPKGIISFGKAVE